MAEAKWCGHDSRGREIEKDDTPEITKRFDLFRSGSKFRGNRLGFVVSMSDIKNLVLAPRYYNPEPRLFLEKLSRTHDLLTVRELVDRGYLSITTGDEPGKLTYSTGDVPFVRTSDLSNWEIKIDPKHCVSEEYYRRVARKQDVREEDILMVRDGTYLIGTCAFVTRYDTKICYQSHIYKLRVHAGGPVDSYLLLALLSSEPVVSQIRAMSFTQDIIDSLGDRIHDLILPIPRSVQRRSSVSELVRKVIQDRVEARELARRAREIVVG
jgi:type I restriction enzyme M protein